MAIRAKTQGWSGVLLLALAAMAWGWDEWRKLQTGAEARQPAGVRQAVGGKSGPAERQGGYERHAGCTWVDDRLNDGDSFKLRLPDGREEVFRLYFVDTPESQFKRYAGGDSNHKRIQDQADYFDGITPEQSVEVGKEAKLFVKALLGKRPFTLFTRWEDPFGDRRYHAFIRLEDGASPAWLDERLVTHGLCRIYTKGADLPDGTPMARHKARLKELEREAKVRRAGAWAK